uniref:Nephrocystin-4 n=1 Tax=Denticeps clupeoides TaxID=299321 RepID=A0AAY4BCM5_9TELE
MTIWRELFDRNRVVPPHSQTVRQAQGPSGCSSDISSLIPMQEVAESSHKVYFQLRVSLFETNHQHFFGRTWKSLSHEMTTSHGPTTRVLFNEVVYFHTSLRISSVVAVVELVSLSEKTGGAQHATGICFGILQLFPGSADPHASHRDGRLPLHLGTPRVLLSPLLFTLQPHPALLPVVHLIPQNVLVSGHESIPGVALAPGETDALRKPHLLKSLACILDGLSISLSPSLESFEKDLLHLLTNWGLDGSAVVIQERRLHVGAHNGWTFLERPQVVVLEPEPAGVEVAVPASGKPPQTGSGKFWFSLTTAFMQCLRWAVWCPFSGSSSSASEEVHLQLLGGPVPNPYDVMCYTVPNKGQIDTELSISQLATTSRYPTLSHSTGSPWQQQYPSQLYPSLLASTHQLSHVERLGASSIAHLEMSMSDVHQTPVKPEPHPQDEEPALQELPFTPVHAPVIALGTQTAGPTSHSSRSSLAHLFSAGFPDIQDFSGQAAEVLDPGEPVNFNPQREEADPLQSDTLILQFLAFSRVPQAGVPTDWPRSVHLTFQLYRFPPVTTQRLQLLSPDMSGKKSALDYPCVLALINKDGTVNSASPGLQLQFPVDSGVIKLGERKWFLRYLALHSLQIDVWDSESLLLIGSAAVELKHLLRQGRPAVQITHELEVITTEYLQDVNMPSGHRPGQRAVPPINVFTTVKGRLHVRLGNVGRPSKRRLGHNTALPPSRSHVVHTNDGLRQFSGGMRNVSRAQRLVETDGDLASLLRSKMKERAGPITLRDSEQEEIRQRKLARMMAVRQYEQQRDDAGSSLILYTHKERLQFSKDLQLIEAYRERSKVEGITNMLSKVITTEHTVYATLGTIEFFEFVLKNPFNVQQTITIESDDPELSVIVSTEEWRYLKELNKTSTPLEENMFHLRENSSTPQIYLRPKESVNIPLKYQTFISGHAIPTQAPSSLRSGKSPQVAQKQQTNTIQAKCIKVTFKAQDGKPLAICQVNVEPAPHVIDQTFRFYHPELTFLKKAIRLPPWDPVPGAPRTDASFPVYVRCSDPNVISGEPQDVYLKVAGGPSPQIKKFFILVFIDHWMAAPAQIWQVYVHFLQRVDISCVAGQLTHQSLVLRGTQVVRKVKCHASHPLELQVDPAEVFVLPPAAVQDVQVAVRPLRPGCKFVYMNVVDVEQHQLVACWLLCVNVRPPIITKAFEIALPVGGGKGSNKKITYTNPYPTTHAFRLLSDHPDLLQFKEDSFEVRGGQTYTIGLRFAPSQSPGAEEILIYINDLEEKNEETFCINVRYR